MGWFTKKKERPDAEDAAIRTIILRQVVAYAFFTPDEGNEPAARQAYWNALGRFAKYLTPWELAFSKTSVSTLSERQRMDASWRSEAMVTLLWALGEVDQLPDYDTQATPELAGRFLSLDPELFVSIARLRPAQEIDKAREIAESWHWRSRTRQLIEDGTQFPDDPNLRAAGFTSFDDIVRRTAEAHIGDGTFAAPIDEDWPAFGKAYRDLSDDEWTIVRSITMERHFTLNWLCGYAKGHRWDETPTDT